MRGDVGKRVAGATTGFVSGVAYSPVLQQGQKQDNGSGDDREVLIQNDRVPFWLKDKQRLETESMDQIGWKSLEPNATRNVLRTHVGKGPVFHASANALTYRCSKTTDLFTMRMERQRRQARQQRLTISTAYKRKAEKVQPVNSSTPDKSTLGGVQDWRERALEQQKKLIRGLPLGPFDHIIEPRYTQLARGARLKPERLERMLVGDIKPNERQILEAMLFNREEALAWEFSEMGRVSRDVTPPLKIKTVPHEVW